MWLASISGWVLICASSGRRLVNADLRPHHLATGLSMLLLASQTTCTPRPRQVSRWRMAHFDERITLANRHIYIAGSPDPQTAARRGGATPGRIRLRAN